MIPSLVVSVSALPKAGKNHFAYTAPEPIKVYCFNGGADFVAQKDEFKDKQIDVHNFTLPIIESETDRWALPVWEEFYAEYRKDIEGGLYATYIFDTSTEIENFCQQAVLEEQQELAEERHKVKQKLATNEFLARNLRMKALFDAAKSNGVNLISLQYLKEQWVKEKGRERAEPTGELILDGWRRTESQADINLELRIKDKAGKIVSEMKIVSSRFGRELYGKTFEDMTFDELIALMFGE